MKIKRIEGFDKYGVSRDGRVWSKARGVWKARKATDNGYGYLKLNIQGKSYKVHQLVANAFLQKPKDAECINHIDGDKHNNAVSNLEWCTLSYNVRHAFDLGLHAGKGVRSGPVFSSKYIGLSSFEYAVAVCDVGNKVLANLLSLFNQRTDSELAKQFGLSKGNVARLRHLAGYTQEASRRRLTSKQVQSIRQRYAEGSISYSKLGAEYRLDKHAMYKIVHRKTYTDVT